MTPRILSIQVGQPRNLGTESAADPHDRPWTSAFHKQPVAGPVRTDAEGLAGDGHADLANHGGADKAVLAYSWDHYEIWRNELGGEPWPAGAFGENLTVAGLAEAGVCIGDVWAAGPVRLQVTQPRVPCWKLCRARRTADLAARVIANGRPGWYLRVLTPGDLSPGLPLELSERPHPDWTVQRAARLMHHDRGDGPAAAALAALPALSAAWRDTLLSRAAGGE